MTVHFQPGYEANILTINVKLLSRDGSKTCRSYLWIFTWYSPYLTWTPTTTQVIECQ